ncbi:MAG: hypothetical protein RMX96_15285 [Nostoc sp. ChiSLP02]|nr:hypothetical protein [Nostoc sp. DedSLP05]MDZ8101854.1 hypothetical protein [Nostoc sp. DedSLP01]MDZ8186204.1 hypothetical protein [Nostoc sp. ChiSLP02]
MVLGRKSAVSTKDTGFWRNSILSLGRRRRSGRLEPTAPSASVLAPQAAPVSSVRRKRSTKKLSVSSANEAIVPQSTKELGRQVLPNLNHQSNETYKTQEIGFSSLPIMPASGATPLWLLRFYAFHRCSAVLAFLLVATTLAVYGWTVYCQELWSQSYRRLQNLQRHERLLTTTNATLTNKMAQEAEQPTTGLVSPTPDKMIFLPPASSTPEPAPSNRKSNSQTQQQTLSPLGY